jgi:bifunctional non-homologous end joining protein LigD
MPSAVALGRLGALVLGRREGDRLTFLNRVGTGVTEASARDLRQQLDPLRSTSRSRRSRAKLRRRGVRVRPELVAEVEFRGWTAGRPASAFIVQELGRRLTGYETDRTRALLFRCGAT